MDLYRQKQLADMDVNAFGVLKHTSSRHPAVIMTNNRERLLNALRKSKKEELLQGIYHLPYLLFFLGVELVRKFVTLLAQHRVFRREYFKYRRIFDADVVQHALTVRQRLRYAVKTLLAV